MAGQGPPPKDPATRRRRNEPTRGEWIEIAEPEKPILPTLPRRLKAQGGWSAQTRSAWNAWRRDPATTQFGPAEIQQALDTAYLYEQFARGDFKAAPEIRIRLDGLGLTAKGKRDLRWKVKDDAEVSSLEEARENRKKASRGRIRAVDPAGVA